MRCHQMKPPTTGSFARREAFRDGAHRGFAAHSRNGVVVPGRVEIDNVQPVVSFGAYPAKAVVGEVVPVSAAVWREGHEAVAATLVVRYLGPRYPQVTETRRFRGGEAPDRPASELDGRPPGHPGVKPLLLPMTMGQEPYVFHGQFT